MRSFTFQLAMVLGLTMPALRAQAQFAPAAGDEKAKKEREEREKARAEKEAKAKALRAEVASKLKFEVEVPDEPISWKRLNSTRISLHIKITNPTEYPAVIAPYFSLKLVDESGKEFRPATRASRSRPLSAKEKKDRVCRLEEVAFLVVPAGGSRTVPVSLSKYDWDPQNFIGYKFTGPGNYRMQFTHSFSLEKFLKGCSLDDCENHTDELKDWNRCCELTRKFEGKLTVSNE